MIRVKVLGGGDYIRMFDQEDGYEVVEDDSFNLVCFTGGTDISPAIYGEQYHPYTMASDRKRDQREVDLYRYCQKRGIPMVGICRGAQLLCALSGGKLYQHVDNHNESHLIHTPEGEMVATSSHHQMMDVSAVKTAEIIGWAEPRSSSYHRAKGTVEAPKKDIEVVYFPRTRSLAHQPHPEWMDTDAPYRQFFFKTIKNYLSPYIYKEAV